MLNTRKIAPGQKGTKKLHEQFGDRFLSVRYRYDRQLRERFKTVELIVEESDWMPPAPFAANAIVGVRIELAEVDIQRLVKQTGGKWNRQLRLWQIRYNQVVALKLEATIEPSTMPNSRQQCLIVGSYIAGLNVVRQIAIPKKITDRR